MKRIESIKVTGSTGQVSADTYDRWTKEIAGLTFEFALCADVSPGQPLLRDLRVCEVSTGFDTGTIVKHPVHKVQLTEASLGSLTTSQVKKSARSALHNQLNKVGHGNFVEAVLRGQIQVSKMGEGKDASAPAS